MLRIRNLYLVIIGVLLSGCFYKWALKSPFDSRVLKVETIDVFNQRQRGVYVKRSWSGDWVFRRERLELIDEELRSSRPDILFFQGMMNRQGSPSESDQKILSAGAIQGYVTETTNVRFYDDTEEEEYLAISYAVPVSKAADTMRSAFWNIGVRGYVAAFVAQHEGVPLALINVRMPDKLDRKFLWYTFLQERISTFLKQNKICEKRLIVAGYLPSDEGASRYKDFLGKLNLRDSAVGFCRVASDCFTGTQSNSIFAATRPEDAPARSDRILVNEEAFVYSGKRTMDRFTPLDQPKEFFGMSQLYPTQRFGWRATLRLPQCPK